MEAGKLTVSFGIDVSALKAGLAVAKAELTNFATQVASVSAKVSTSVKSTLNSISDFAKNLAIKVSASVKEMLSKLKDTVKKYGDDMESIGSSLSTFISLPLAAAGGWAINLAGKLEATALSFKVLTKDAAAALMIQKQLNDYADRSPFSSEDVVLAGKRMVAYRFAVQDVLPYLKDAGDLAAAFADQGVRIADVASVFGQLKSGNFGEAFERLRDFGISRELLEGKGLKFDKSGEYKGSVQQALAGVRAVIQENFGGMSNALGTTLPGILATASDTIERFAQDIGKSLVESFDVKTLLTDFTNFVNGLRESFSKLDPDIKKVILSVGVLAVAVPPLLATLGMLATTVLPALAAGFGLLATPVAAIGLAIGGIIVYWDTFNAILDKTIARIYQFKGALLAAVGQTGAAADAFKMGSLWWEEGKKRDAAIVSPQVKAREEAERQEMLARNAARRNTRYGTEPPPTTTGTNRDVKTAAEIEAAAKKATKALLDMSDARIKAGLDAIKYKETDNKHGVISGIDVYQMAPIRDVKITPASNIFPDFSNAIDTKVLGDKLKEASDFAIEVLKQSELNAQLEETRDSIRGAFEGMFSGWNISGMQEALKTSLEGVNNMAQAQLDNLNNMTKILPNIVSSLSSGFQAMGEAFVNGGNPFEAFGRSIISSFGDILMQIGQQMLKQAAALVALAVATQGALSPVAIRTGIAGGALVAAGAALKASSSSKRSYASGWGGAYGPTNMVFGDHAGRSIDNPEYVLRHDQVKSILNRAADRAGGGNGGFIAETVIRGADLRLLLKRAETLATS